MKQNETKCNNYNKFNLLKTILIGLELELLK